MVKAKGFTLIELLIASSIFSVVMLTIYSAFSVGVFGYRSIEKTIEIYQAASRVLGQLELDLSNLAVYADNETKFKGESDSLSFLTLLNSYQKDAMVENYAGVEYRLKDLRFLRLMRKNFEVMNQSLESEPEEMADNVVSLNLSYGDYNTQGQAVEFKDKWENQTALPSFVRIELGLENKAKNIKDHFERTILIPQVE